MGLSVFQFVMGWFGRLQSWGPIHLRWLRGLQLLFKHMEGLMLFWVAHEILPTLTWLCPTTSCSSNIAAKMVFCKVICGRTRLGFDLSIFLFLFFIFTRYMYVSLSIRMYLHVCIYRYVRVGFQLYILLVPRNAYNVGKNWARCAALRLARSGAGNQESGGLTAQGFFFIFSLHHVEVKLAKQSEQCLAVGAATLPSLWVRRQSQHVKLLATCS